MSVDGSITPIVYLGFNRSGTTWLGNMITEHYKVAAVSHELHYGILENTLGSYCTRFVEFSDDRHYVAFVSEYIRSDYFLASGLNPAVLYGMRPKNVIEFFLELMDKVAQARETTHWITKVDPALLFVPGLFNRFVDEIESRYPKVYWIGVYRNFSGYAKSKTSLDKNRGRKWIRRALEILYTGCQYYSFNRYARRFIVRVNGIMLHYDWIKKNKKKSLSLIGEYIEAEDRSKPETPHYLKNTSFGSDPRNRETILWAIAGMVCWLGSFVIKYIVTRRLKRVKSPVSYNRIELLRKNKQELVENLRSNGERSLADRI